MSSAADPIVHELTLILDEEGDGEGENYREENAGDMDRGQPHKMLNQPAHVGHISYSTFKTSVRQQDSKRVYGRIVRRNQSPTSLQSVEDSLPPSVPRLALSSTLQEEWGRRQKGNYVKSRYLENHSQKGRVDKRNDTKSLVPLLQQMSPAVSVMNSEKLKAFSRKDRIESSVARLARPRSAKNTERVRNRARREDEGKVKPHATGCPGRGEEGKDCDTCGFQSALSPKSKISKVSPERIQEAALRMYSMKNIYEKRREEKRNILKAEEDKKCTGKPQINPKSKEMVGELEPLFARSSKMIAAKNDKIESERRRREEKDFKTLHEGPKIDKRSKSMVKQGGFQERMEQWNESRSSHLKDIQQLKEQQEKATCTFQPLLHPSKDQEGGVGKGRGRRGNSVAAGSRLHGMAKELEKKKAELAAESEKLLAAETPFRPQIGKKCDFPLKAENSSLKKLENANIFESDFKNSVRRFVRAQPEDMKSSLKSSSIKERAEEGGTQDNEGTEEGGKTKVHQKTLNSKGGQRREPSLKGGYFKTSRNLGKPDDPGAHPGPRKNYKKLSFKEMVSRTSDARIAYAKVEVSSISSPNHKGQAKEEEAGKGEEDRAKGGGSKASSRRSSPAAAAFLRLQGKNQDCKHGNWKGEGLSLSILKPVGERKEVVEAETPPEPTGVSQTLIKEEVCLSPVLAGVRIPSLKVGSEDGEDHSLEVEVPQLKEIGVGGESKDKEVEGNVKGERREDAEKEETVADKIAQAMQRIDLEMTVLKSTKGRKTGNSRIKKFFPLKESDELQSLKEEKDTRSCDLRRKDKLQALRASMEALRQKGQQLAERGKGRKEEESGTRETSLDSVDAQN